MVAVGYPVWACQRFVKSKVSPACVQAFLRHLQQRGVDTDVVFIDMDALVVAPMAPLFAPAGASPAFAYAVTLSDAVAMCASSRCRPCLMLKTVPALNATYTEHVCLPYVTALGRASTLAACLVVIHAYALSMHKGMYFTTMHDTVFYHHA